MILKDKKELSTEVITHKLKIKGEGTKYISSKMAENIFEQFKNLNNKTITIVNEKNLTFITKYRSEIDLIKLNSESRDFEDTLFLSGLSEYQKEKVRDMWELRRRNKQPRSNINLKHIINSFK